MYTSALILSFKDHLKAVTKDDTFNSAGEVKSRKVCPRYEDLYLQITGFCIYKQQKLSTTLVNENVIHL